MKKQGNANNTYFFQNMYLWITGLSIGGLIGLSISPVVSIVITSVVLTAFLEKVLRVQKQRNALSQPKPDQP